MAVKAVRSRPPTPSLARHVVDTLREMILNGEFEEGEQLRRDALAQMLHVSRMPSPLYAAGHLVHVRALV